MARSPMRTISVPAWWTDQADATPVLIELTAKRWKGLMLASAALMLLGLAVLGWQMWSEVYRPILDTSAGGAHFQRFGDAMGGVVGTIGWLLVTFATGLGLYARFMAWWRHG